MNEANRRQRLLLGIAAGAALAALLVIPLALVVDDGLADGDAAAAPSDSSPATPEAPETPDAAPSFDPAAAAAGEALFGSCSGCHGADALGVAGLGKALVASDFVNGTSNADLVAFLKVGRGTDDPANTTGVGMPAKGGNPALSDDDLGDIVAYIRSLN